MSPNAKHNPPDGETRTSRVVGSVDFVRPKLPINNDVDESKLLTTVTGVRCSMPYTIKCSTESFANPEYAHVRIEQIALSVFQEVDSKLSTFNPDSEVNKVNSMGVDDVHIMSDALKEVVLCSKELVKLTRGAFDPCVSPLLKHYESMAERSASLTNDTSLRGSSHSNGSNHERLSSITELPELDGSEEVDIETIRRQRHVVDYWRSLVTAGFAGDPSDLRVSRTVRQLLEISQWHSGFSVGLKDVNDNEDHDSSGSNLLVGDEYTIRKKHADARMDLNGIAKGWAVDKIAEALPSPCWVEWGGDVKVRGNHPSGRCWQVAVVEPPSLAEMKLRLTRAKKAGQKGPVFTLADEHMKDEEQKVDQRYLAVFDLRDGEAVATSGDYEKIIARDGKMYSHVINPQVGCLLELNKTTLAQAVIVTKSCMVSDAIATAAISKSDASQARGMLDQFRTGYRVPVKDFLLYARQGPRIIRQTIPGLESKVDRERRLSRHQSATVIVVGGGLAGFSAAISAADCRANVILLEKEPQTGGNSSKATSGINGWGSDTQAELGVSDEERLFERDTFRSGLGGRSDYSLVRTLSTKSSDAIHWLKHEMKVPLTVLSQLGGHSAKRTHRAPAVNGNPVPIGYKIMSTLRDVVNHRYEDKIEIRCGMNVTNLIHHVDCNGIKTVTGVEVNGKTIDADAVVLATGGFGCCQSNDGLMARFRPDLIGTPTTNGHFAQGDGVVLGEKLGAELIDMDKVQLHPTGFIDPKDPSNSTKYLAPEALRGSGGILVNSEGKRFINELDLRSVVAAGIQNNCSKYLADGYDGPAFAYCILSDEAQELFGKPSLSFYKDRLGLFEECADITAVSKLIGCEKATLEATLKDYCESARIGTCKLTHKDVFPSTITPESRSLVVARVTPSIHYTMGGLNINPDGEVQERIESIIGSHRRIRGLFAAGEVTGGVHGGNRLGGNSLLECVVFGRIAGERAATIKHPDSEMFPNAKSPSAVEHESNFVPVVLREVRNTDLKYGLNTREIRFSMHGSFQHSGMDVGQFVAIRGELDGETLMGYFSPITRPSDEGVIGILARSDARGGPIAKLFELARPGSTFYMCAMGGLRLKFEKQLITYRNNEVKRIGLLAGGTGIAPMIQIIRSYGHYVKSHPNPEHLPKLQLNLIYACEEMNDLAYMQILDTVRCHFPDHFRYYVKLNRPPLGWTEGVGFVERSDIVKYLFSPRDGSLVVICGPPVFEAAMTKTLLKVGFDKSQYYSYSEGDNVAAHL